jgi:hypothetical protein
MPVFSMSDFNFIANLFITRTIFCFELISKYRKMLLWQCLPLEFKPWSPMAPPKAGELQFVLGIQGDTQAKA